MTLLGGKVVVIMGALVHFHQLLEVGEPLLRDPEGLSAVKVLLAVIHHGDFLLLLFLAILSPVTVVLVATFLASPSLPLPLLELFLERVLSSGTRLDLRLRVELPLGLNFLNLVLGDCLSLEEIRGDAVLVDPGVAGVLGVELGHDPPVPKDFNILREGLVDLVDHVWHHEELAGDNLAGRVDSLVSPSGPDKVHLLQIPGVGLRHRPTLGHGLVEHTLNSLGIGIASHGKGKEDQFLGWDGTRLVSPSSSSISKFNGETKDPHICIPW